MEYQKLEKRNLQWVAT